MQSAIADVEEWTRKAEWQLYGAALSMSEDLYGQAGYIAVIGRLSEDRSGGWRGRSNVGADCAACVRLANVATALLSLYSPFRATRRLSYILFRLFIPDMNHQAPYGIPYDLSAALAAQHPFRQHGPDSGYNSPYVSSPFSHRRPFAKPTGISFGSMDSLLVPGGPPSLEYLGDDAMAARAAALARARSSDSVLTACCSPVSSRSSSRASTPTCSPLAGTRKHARTLRSPVRGLSRANETPGVAFCFPPTTAHSAHLTVVHREFREPRSRSLSPLVVDRSLDMDVSDEEFEVASSPPALRHDQDPCPLPSPAHQQRTKRPKVKRVLPAKPKARMGVKQCACCGVTSTPLWRDIGGQLPLCNACGIRFKKYGICCPDCNYVPCKQQRDAKTCPRCQLALPTPSKRAKVPAC